MYIWVLYNVDVTVSVTVICFMRIIMLWYIYRLLEPCDDCAPPYGFRNEMSLTQNTATFKVSERALDVTMAWMKSPVTLKESL